MATIIVENAIFPTPSTRCIERLPSEFFLRRLSSKTRMMALPCGDKFWQYVHSLRHHSYQYWTYRPTDRRTDGQKSYINIVHQLLWW